MDYFLRPDPLFTQILQQVNSVRYIISALGRTEDTSLLKSLQNNSIEFFLLGKWNGPLVFKLL